MTSVNASLLSLALFVGVITVLIYNTRLAFPEVDISMNMTIHMQDNSSDIGGD